MLHMNIIVRCWKAFARATSPPGHRSRKRPNGQLPDSTNALSSSRRGLRGSLSVFCSILTQCGPTSGRVSSGSTKWGLHDVA